MNEGRRGAEASQLLRVCPPAGTCPWDTPARRAKVPAGVRRPGGETEKLCGARRLRAGVHAWSEAKAAPPGEMTGRGGRQRGACAHMCASCRYLPGGGACTPVLARVGACVHTDTRGRQHRSSGLEAGAGVAAAHTTRTPTPTPHPPPPAPPGLDRPVTFLLSPHLFLLVAGVHVAVGVAGFKLQVPQAHGQTGRCGVGGIGGGTREGKSQEGSASHAVRSSPVATFLPQPALGFGSHPPQPRGRRHSSTSEPVN